MIFGAIKITFLSFYHGIINIPFENGTSKFFGLLNYLNIFYFFKKKIPSSERLNAFLESMGPLFIKFGQLLSTRPDLVGEKQSSVLKKFQNDLKPFSTSEAIKIVEQDLESPIDQIFESFSEEPLAAASIAQVHEAILKDGESVVVKIVRPGLDKRISADVNSIKFLGGLAELILSDARRLKLMDLIREYELVITAETDLKKEAANAIQTKNFFKENFSKRK